jgi:hypothetical protein
MVGSFQKIRKEHQKKSLNGKKKERKQTKVVEKNLSKLS